MKTTASERATLREKIDRDKFDPRTRLWTRVAVALLDDADRAAALDQLARDLREALTKAERAMQIDQAHHRDHHEEEDRLRAQLAAVDSINSWRADYIAKLDKVVEEARGVYNSEDPHYDDLGDALRAVDAAKAKEPTHG